MSSFLIIFACILNLIYGQPAPGYRHRIRNNHFDVTYGQPIVFNEWIENIKQTAMQSVEINQNIYKMYEHVIGPIEEMDGIEIGRVEIQFIPSRSQIIIAIIINGRRHLKIQIMCALQTAEISEIKKIDGGLSGNQLMVFSNAILSKLEIQRAYLWDVANLEYTGCYGFRTSVRLIDLCALQGKTRALFERFDISHWLEWN